MKTLSHKYMPVQVSVSQCRSLWVPVCQLHLYKQPAVLKLSVWMSNAHFPRCENTINNAFLISVVNPKAGSKISSTGLCASSSSSSASSGISNGVRLSPRLVLRGRQGGTGSADHEEGREGGRDAREREVKESQCIERGQSVSR